MLHSFRGRHACAYFGPPGRGKAATLQLSFLVLVELIQAFNVRGAGGRGGRGWPAFLGWRCAATQEAQRPLHRPLQRPLHRPIFRPSFLSLRSSRPPTHLAPLPPQALSDTRSLLSGLALSNPTLLAAATASLGLHLVAMYTTLGGTFFSLVPLSMNEWALVVIFAAPCVVIEEGLKFAIRQATLVGQHASMHR